MQPLLIAISSVQGRHPKLKSVNFTFGNFKLGKFVFAISYEDLYM